MKRRSGFSVVCRAMLGKILLPAAMFLVALPGAQLSSVVALGAVGFMAMPGTALAQSEPPCDPADPTDDDNDGDGCPTNLPQKSQGSSKSPSGTDCNCYKAPQGTTGDPVDNATGNMYRRENDWQGNGPFPLAMERSYNSLFSVTANESGGSIASYVSPVGKDWTFAYASAILPDAGSPLTSIKSMRADGQVLTYTRANGVWSPDADINSKLTEQTDASGAPTGWTLITEAVDTERYDAAGRLLSITNLAGFTQTLAYSTVSTPASVAPAPGLLITVTDSLGRQLRFTWNSQRRIATATSPDGVTSYTYASNGTLTDVTHPDSSVRHYTYYATGSAYLLTDITDEKGQAYAHYTYDTSYYNITSTTLAGGADATSMNFVATNAGKSTTVVDALGATRTYRYDNIVNRFRNLSVEKPCLGCANPVSTTTMVYDANGYVSSFTDKPGDSSTPQNTTLTWDTAHNLMLSRTEAVGTPAARTVAMTWNAALRLPLTEKTTDAQSHLMASTGWVYNARGQPLARCEIDPAKAPSYTCSNAGTAPTGVRRWMWTYCDQLGRDCAVIGRMRSATGPRTDLVQRTTFSYYDASDTGGCGTPGAPCHQAGDLYRVADPLGHLTTFNSYDGSGRPTRITDANGVATDLTYNNRGWLITRTIDGAQTVIGYDAIGEVTSLKDPTGLVSTFTYDAAHRLTGTTDGQGNAMRYTLDAAGNRTAVQMQLPDGTVTRSQLQTFNALSQLTAVVDGLNRTVFSAANVGYDAHANRVQSTDALGVASQQGFDALNRLVSTVGDANGTSTATKNAQSVFSYDALDRIDGASDPDGISTLYTWDALSNRTALQSPDAGNSSDTYDAAGNRITHTDARGIKSTSTYDALNRLTATTYPDATLNVSYRYDEDASQTACPSSAPIGRLTRIIEGTGAFNVGYCYDKRGNLIRKRQSAGGQIDITSTTYDKADRPLTITTPDTTVIAYAYDTSGRLNKVSVTPAGDGSTSRLAVSALTWRPFGPISSYTLGNGQHVTRTYDANDRLTDLTGPAFNLHLKRDAIGNIVALGNTPGASPATETYRYDRLYRLQGAFSPTSALETYGYNRTGDRVSKNGSGLATGLYTYAAGTHRLTGTGNAVRTNDANGNTLTSNVGGSSYAFTYDARNRLSQVKSNGAIAATYQNNALGQRLVKVTPTGTERYIYDEAGHLLAEYGLTNRDYIWAGDLPVAVIDNTINGSVTTSTVNYITADQLDTPRAVSNAAGATVWNWAYQTNAFGEKAPAASGGYVLNLRFAGQYFDAETGTSYNYFRNYESATGRYAQSDPMGLMGGMSTYAYAGNNPLVYTDPTGTTIWHVGIFVAGFDSPIGGVTLGRFQATSDCKDGKIGFAQGTIGSLGSDFGGKAGFIGYTVDLDDGLDYIDPNVLNGLYVSEGGGLVIGGGVTYGNVRLGAARGTFGWGGAGGLSFGEGADFGVSHVTTSSIVPIK